MRTPRIPHACAIFLPASLCAGALAAALAVCLFLGIGGTDILFEYLAVSLVSGPLALYLWLMAGARRAQFRRSVHRQIVALLRERWSLLLLPLVLFPLFMTAFTTLKSAFPLLTGYHWDPALTAIDAALFGQDPWRLTHAAIGREGTAALSFIYSIGWTLALGLALPLYTLYAPPRAVGRAFTALMATWLTVGVAGAALLSSAGPVFAGAVDPSLAAHFQPLHQTLTTKMEAHDPVLLSQGYLANGLFKPLVVKGGGVSAMPSMHLAVCAFLVLLAGRTQWRWPALIFTAVIWLGSVHFGYHYATDGLIAIPLAILCWRWAHRDTHAQESAAFPLPEFAPA